MNVDGASTRAIGAGMEPQNQPSDLRSPTIRNFCMEDYDALTALWQEVRLPYKPAGRDARKRIEKEIQRSGTIFLVAELDGRLIGSVLATHDGRKGWINRLAVASPFRRRGIARMLVEEAERQLADADIEIVACLIEDWNQESQRFFQNIGYDRFEQISYFTKKKHPRV
jgi:ribosomal protein S18 acetylase RimI-like enzyme